VQTIHDVESLRTLLADLRASNQRIALVPTMGALHAGHLALVHLAQRHADRVIVSIFVNPKQFGPKEDYDAYPRTLAADQAELIAAGVDLLWAPSAAVMYPPGFATTVSVAGLGDHLCGAERPGHFDGVATVVTKLFAQIRPDVALFGEKDWQQLAIIRRLNDDLNLGVEIKAGPIVREADGLALSSRNAYLDPAQRAIAAHFPKILQSVCRAVADGVDVTKALGTGRAALESIGVDRVDYLEIIDRDSLTILSQVNDAEGRRIARLIAAVRIGPTRLIDNMAVYERINLAER